MSLEDFRIPDYKAGQRFYSHGDYIFSATKKRTYNGQVSTYLRCVEANSDYRCPVKWTNRSDSHDVGAVEGAHNHVPSTWLKERNDMFSNLKRRTQSETTPLIRIYEEEALRFPQGAAHLPYPKTSMHRWRRESQPPMPHNLIEYGEALQRTHPNLILDTVEVGGGVAVILKCSNYVDILSRSSVLAFDGTFKTVPAGVQAAQILTIHSIIQGQYYHPIVVLMSNRRHNLYRVVLNRVFAASGVRAETLLSDFEPALQNALQEIAPPGCRIQGCFFHFAQALVRRARRLRMSVRPGSNSSNILRLYIALALLPANQIGPALAEIPLLAEINNWGPVNPQFAEYFRDYWINTVGVEIFSVHGNVHRTTNCAESFHNSMRFTLGQHGNIWAFTERIEAKLEISATRAAAAFVHGGVSRRNRSSFMVRQNIIVTAERELRSGLITIREFLLRVSNVRVMLIGDIVNEEDVPGIGLEIEVDPVAPVAEPVAPVAAVPAAGPADPVVRAAEPVAPVAAAAADGPADPVVRVAEPVAPVVASAAAGRADPVLRAAEPVASVAAVAADGPADLVVRAAEPVAPVAAAAADGPANPVVRAAEPVASIAAAAAAGPADPVVRAAEPVAPVAAAAADGPADPVVRVAEPVAPVVAAAAAGRADPVLRAAEPVASVAAAAADGPADLVVRAAEPVAPVAAAAEAGSADPVLRAAEPVAPVASAAVAGPANPVVRAAEPVASVAAAAADGPADPVLRAAEPVAPVAAAAGPADPVIRAAEETRRCVVCIESSPTHVVIPCGHFVLCSECVVHLALYNNQECVICRQPVISMIRVLPA